MTKAFQLLWQWVWNKCADCTPIYLGAWDQVAHRKKWEKKNKYICVACCILEIKVYILIQKKSRKFSQISKSSQKKSGDYCLFK